MTGKIERDLESYEQNICNRYEKIYNNIVTRFLCEQELSNEVINWYNNAMLITVEAACIEEYRRYCLSLYHQLGVVMDIFGNKERAINAMIKKLVQHFGMLSPSLEPKMITDANKCDIFMQRVIGRMDQTVTTNAQCAEIIEEEIDILNGVAIVSIPASAEKVEQPIKLIPMKVEEIVPKMTMPPNEPSVPVEAKILEFNINHPTGVTGDIYINISMVLEGFKDSNSLREIMFRNISDLNYYYIDRAETKLQQLDMARIKKAYPNAVRDLPQYVNDYVKISVKAFVDHFGPECLSMISENSTYNMKGSVLLIIDDDIRKPMHTPQIKYNNDVDAIKAMANEMNTTKQVYDIDALYSMYTQFAATPTNKKTFSLTFSRYTNVDLTYRSKNLPASIPIGVLVKSVAKTNTGTCYYIYNGAIPPGTRNPWLKSSIL